MSDEAEPPFLVCMPRKAGPAPVPNAVNRVCCRCRAQVWVAPSGVRLQRERGAALLCMPCFAVETNGEPVVTEPLTEQQRREIAAHLRETAT